MPTIDLLDVLIVMLLKIDVKVSVIRLAQAVVGVRTVPAMQPYLENQLGSVPEVSELLLCRVGRKYMAYFKYMKVWVGGLYVI